MSGSAFDMKLIHMPVEVVGMTPVGIKHSDIDEIGAGREVEAVDV